MQRSLRLLVPSTALRVVVLLGLLALSPMAHAAGPVDSFTLKSGQYTVYDDLPMPKPGPNNWQSMTLEDCANLCLGTSECGMFLYSGNKNCRMHKASAVAKLGPQKGYDAYVRKPPVITPWKLGRLVNNSGQEISIGIPLANGGSATADVTSSLQNLALFVPGQGVIAFQYDSAGSSCPTSPRAKVTVSFGERTWGFYYDAGTPLDITLNADGTFTLTPGRGGQIVPAGQSVQCVK